MKPLIKHAFFITVCCLCGVSSNSLARALDKAVVIVNGAPITQKDINDKLNFIKRYQPDVHQISPQAVVKSLIVEEVLVQNAQRNGMWNSEELNAEFRKQIQSKQVHPELARDPEKLKRMIVLEQTQMALLQSQLEALSEEEISKEMKLIPKQAKMPPVKFHLETLYIPIDATASEPFYLRWKWLRYLIKRCFTIKPTLVDNRQQKVSLARERAELALKEAQSGLSMEAVSNRLRPHVHTKAEKRWRPLDRLPSAYLAAFKKLGVGQVAGPFEFYNGFHLVRLKALEGPYLFNVRHILLEPRKEEDHKVLEGRLRELKQKCIEKQIDFAACAEHYSEDPKTAFNGGSLGWVLSTTVEKPFVEHVQQLNPEQISEPFLTSQGWHIVQLIERQWLTPAHDRWKYYLAKASLQERKLFGQLEKLPQKILQSATVEWLDKSLAPTE